MIGTNAVCCPAGRIFINIKMKRAEIFSSLLVIHPYHLHYLKLPWFVLVRIAQYAELEALEFLDFLLILM